MHKPVDILCAQVQSYESMRRIENGEARTRRGGMWGVKFWSETQKIVRDSGTGLGTQRGECADCQSYK